jgi:hypothetical protein
MQRAVDAGLPTVRRFSAAFLAALLFHLWVAGCVRSADQRHRRAVLHFSFSISLLSSSACERAGSASPGSHIFISWHAASLILSGAYAAGVCGARKRSACASD